MFLDIVLVTPDLGSYFKRKRVIIEAYFHSVPLGDIFPWSSVCFALFQAKTKKL